MTSSCQRCDQDVSGTHEARACSFGCTFCAACAAAMNDRCPNCGGALAVRYRSA